MMADEPSKFEGVSRRKFLAGATAAGAVGLAGCGGGGDGGDTGGNGGDTGGNGGDTGGNSTPMEEGLDTTPLTADGSSTVFPIANGGATVWGSNPEAGDQDYWLPSNWDDIYTEDMRLADYFANIYGYEPTGERSNPPFLVNVALSHSGTGVEAVESGRVDIGNSSGRVQDELDRDSYEDFINHVVGVDGQPIAVSSEIYDAGVTGITLEELKQIYQGEITNWSEVGGPDREILVLGRAAGSGTSTAFRANVFGNPDIQLSAIQNRYGQNQQLRTAIANADNAISYIALAFIDEPDADDAQVVPISLEVEGTTYEYRGDPGLGAKAYPLSRDLHMYTWEDTSIKESAFINMFLTDYGQEVHVRGNNYFGIGPSRIETQKKNLAEPPNGFPMMQ
ncbi:MAG: substrate-binding domain-containing protein [Salinirussus sp.]